MNDDRFLGEEYGPTFVPPLVLETPDQSSRSLVSFETADPEFVGRVVDETARLLDEEHDALPAKLDWEEAFGAG